MNRTVGFDAPPVSTCRSLIVGLHQDRAQSTTLRRGLDGVVDADVIMADAISELLDVIDLRTPDLILVDPLISPCDADYLAWYLALLSDASHVQTISIPVLSPSARCDASLQSVDRKDWLSRRLLSNRQLTPAVVGGNPEAFAAEVATYLSLSLRIKGDSKERERHGVGDGLGTVERRQASRWSAKQACLTQPVFVATDRGELVNISSTGLLVRTETRPYPHSSGRGDGRHQNQLALTLSTASRAIRRTGAPVWCRPQPLGDGRFLYEVAFRFDTPLELGLSDPLVKSVGNSSGSGIAVRLP
jgi:hypothetical protein